MKHILLAKRYAKALFDLAIEDKTVEKINTDMELVAVVMKENRELRRMMVNPIISPAKKKAIIKQIFENHISKTTLAFLDILIRKGREEDIDEIATQFNELYLDYNHLIVANLVTATAIDENLRARLTGMLKPLTTKDIQLTETIDENIIGGFKLKMNDYQYDASISKIIRRLNQEFDKNLFIKGF